MYVVVVGVKIDPDRMTEVRQFLNDVIAPRAQEFAGFRVGSGSVLGSVAVLLRVSGCSSRARWRDRETNVVVVSFMVAVPFSLVDFVGHGTVRVANRRRPVLRAPIELGSRRRG